MDIGKSLQTSLDLYLKHFGILFLATLIGAIITAVSFGILAGPVCGGLLLLGLNLLRGSTGEVREVFQHFDKFLPTLLVTLIFILAILVVSVIERIPLLGFLFGILVGPLLGTLYFLTLGLVIKDDLPPLTAFHQSLAWLHRKPLSIWLYSLLVSFLAGLGAFACFIPVILTMPFGTAGMAVAYHELSRQIVDPNRLLERESFGRTMRIVGIVVAILFIIGLFSWGWRWPHFPY